MDKAVDNPLSLNISWENNEDALEAWKKVDSLVTRPNVSLGNDNVCPDLLSTVYLEVNDLFLSVFL